MQKLPIGIQSFEKIREDNYLYIDKTKQILQLIQNGYCYFLSRPRRFGKSLTLSTLEAMFKGKAELFKGLYAEEWVKEQSKNPNPVIKLDMGGLGNYENTEEFKYALIYLVKKIANDYKLNISYDETISKNSGLIFSQVINELYKQFGKVVVLIDEYDKPMTDNIDNLEKANEMREILRPFYSILKDRDEVKFIMFTGVSKFSKSGVFSGLNNLKNISMSKEYADIVGYTQKELEENFSDWLHKTEKELSMDREELLSTIEEYYDGFSFDGIVRVYNPLSILNFFSDQEFNNYWYISATPSFLANYLKTHRIDDIEEFRHLEVSSDFADEHEIEKATPESFLFQAGYLTIEKKERKNKVVFLTLDYPNEEVKQSMSRLFLKDIYKIRKYIPLGDLLWESIKSLNEGNIENIVEIFNSALKKIPYNDFPKNKNEYWYRSLFVMLLRGGAGVSSFQESYTKDGRSDLIIPFDDKIIIIEFKFANNSKEIDKKRAEGQEQVQRYAESYKNEGKKIITVVLVADNEKRQVVV